MNTEIEIDKKLREIMADIFEVNEKEINEDSSPDSIKNWDSLQQLTLATAIEEGFDISLTADDITDMLSFKIIKEIILEKVKVR